MEEAEEEQALGPEQGGAAGKMPEESRIQEDFIGLPLHQNRDEEEDIKQLLKQRFSRPPSQPSRDVQATINWPERGAFINDFNHSNLQAKIFPTLFPFGVGDVTSKDRLVTVTQTESNKHLLNYVIPDGKGNYRFPFAEHSRWMHWAQNTAERHRASGQRSYYLKKNPGDANLTEDELIDIVAENGPRFHELVGRMHSYNANLNGSNAYLYKARTNLEALMEQEGTATSWFSFSAADNHWADLHQLLHNDTESPDELEKAKARRKMVRDNPHIVDEFFNERVNQLFKTLFGQHGIELKYLWFRIEYQKRGAAHVHGCLKLKDDPGVAALSQQVLDGRIAQRELSQHGQLGTTRFPDESTERDEWLTCDADVVEDAANQLSDGEVEECEKLIEKGIAAENIVINFNDWLVTTMNASNLLPRDAASERHPSTKFTQGPLLAHPASVHLVDLQDESQSSQSDHYCQLVGAVQRHFCQNYCLRKRTIKKNDGSSAVCQYCRFGYAKDMVSKSHLVMKQHRNKDGIKYSIELETQRNDQWLNSHIRAVSEVWLANIDMQLLVDVGKVADYMTKYVTKAEPMSSGIVSGMIEKVMHAHPNTETQSILRRVMGKVLGERPISRQETCHLINKLPIVKCSHDFVSVQMDEKAEAMAPTVSGNDEATIMSMIRAYGSRLELSNWPEGRMPEHLCKLSLQQFASKYYVGRSGKLKGKLQPHRSGRKKVMKFLPRFSHNPSGAKYWQYCKYALVQFQPWAGSINQDSPWPEGTRKKEMIKAWEDFVDKLRNSGQPVPDQLSRAIRDKMVSRIDKRRGNGDSPEDDEEDKEDEEDEEEWMAMSSGKYVANLQEEALLGDGLDPSDVSIPWNKDHDWTKLQNVYPDGFTYSFPSQFEQMRKSFKSQAQRPTQEKSDLNPEQKLAHDIMVMAVKQFVRDGSSCSSQNKGRLLIVRGVGGTGKSFVINATLTTLSRECGLSEEDFLVMATTAKAASVINGCTLHSARDGLAVPISYKKYQPLAGEALRAFQNRLRCKKIVILDEYSMLRPKELYFMHLRLQQAMGNDEIFGGLPVVLCGDPGQLPAVASPYLLWSENIRSGAKDSDDRNGCMMYKLFENSVKLVKNNRVNPDDPDSVFFESFLVRLRDGNCTHDDWKKVKQICSNGSMSQSEWIKRGFADKNVSHIFFTNAAVNEHNKRLLLMQNQPIARIEAQHDLKEGRNLADDNFWGLQLALYLCVNAMVTLQINLCLAAGLVNGTEGLVKDIVYDDSSDGSDPTRLPKFVMVDFGSKYTGPSFFPDDTSRRGWVPISPFKETCGKQKGPDRWIELSREMLPLRLSWAMTAWKSQGQTFLNNIILDLGSKEVEHGVTYVVFSRGTALSKIGIIGGITKQRLCEKVADHPKMAPRIQAEERLNVLSKLTKEFFGPYFANHGRVSAPPAPRRVRPHPRGAYPEPMYAPPPYFRFRRQTQEESQRVDDAVLNEGPPLGEILVKYPRHNIVRRDMRTSKRGEWLNDEFINTFLSIANHDVGKSGRMVVSTFFTTKMMQLGCLESNMEYSYDAVRRWKPLNFKDGTTIFDLKSLLFPVNLIRQHYFLVELDFENKQINVYDSKMRSSRQPFADAFMQFLQDESLAKRSIPLEPGWTASEVVDTPQQDNGVDCGVFTSMFATMLLSEQSIHRICQQNIINHRLGMALSILQMKIVEE